MLRHRPIAFLVLVTLLAALLPGAQGEGCRLCGEIGRCCCFSRPAAAPAASHCAKMQGGRAACSLDRSPFRPAAFRVPRTLPERTGSLASLVAAPGGPDPGLLLAAGMDAPRPSRISAAPLTPPPRAFRTV